MTNFAIIDTCQITTRTGDAAQGTWGDGSLVDPRGALPEDHVRQLSFNLREIDEIIEIVESLPSRIDEALMRILHPLRLMLAVEGDNVRIAAVLHDVVEDTDTSLDDLRAAGFSAEVLEAVALLTHAKEEEHFAYVSRLAANPIARHVKRADLRDNMDLTRIPTPHEKDHVRIRKYGEALAILDSFVA